MQPIATLEFSARRIPSPKEGINRKLNKMMLIRNGTSCSFRAASPRTACHTWAHQLQNLPLSSFPRQQACFLLLSHAASPGAFSALETSGAFTTASLFSLFLIRRKSLWAGGSSLQNAEGATTYQRRREHTAASKPSSPALSPRTHGPLAGHQTLS